MKITDKTKFKELSKLQPLLKLAGKDILEECLKFNNEHEKPFEKISGIELKNGYYVSWDDLTKFWDCETDDEFISLTAKVYLGIEKKSAILNLPLIDFCRCINYAKYILKEAAVRLEKIKHEPTQEEKDAGADEIKGSQFKLIRYYMSISPLKFSRFEDAESQPWTIIISELEAEYESNKLKENLLENQKKQYDKL